MRILINAVHTQTGGGLVYLNSLLPHLAQEPNIDWVIVCQKEFLERILIPKSMEIKLVKGKKSEAELFIWEQVVLPIKQRIWGCKAMWCNANYAPLFARGKVITIHNNADAIDHCKGWLKLYWWLLICATRLSILFGAKGVSVSQYIISRYTKGICWWMKRHIWVATSAVNDLYKKKNVFSLKDKAHIVSIGDVYIQKNYITLLNAFKLLKEKMPEAKLSIIGEKIDKKLSKEIENFIVKNKFEKCIFFEGSVSHASLIKTLKQATLYCSTSLAESFNMPVLEAMTVGTAVVAADLPFQREVAGNTAVYVPVDRGGDIAAAYAVALYGLLENKSLREWCVRAAMEESKKYSWQKTSKTLVDVLKKQV